MISTLQDLVAPLTEAEFIALLRGREIAYRPGCGLNRFQELIGWRELHDLIVSGKFPVERLRVLIKTKPILKSLYLQQGKINAAALDRLVTYGVSLIMNRVDGQVSSLATVCRQMESQLGEDIGAAAVLTTGAGGALKLHYDRQDVIVVQVAGAKRWRIREPPVVNPVKGLPRPSPPEGAPIFDQTLQAGDLLFVPGGYWHQCENAGDLSLHVGFHISPPTGWHAVEALTSKLLSDELFRVRLTRLAGAEELATLEIALKQRLIETIERLSLTEFLASRGTHGSEAADAADEYA